MKITKARLRQIIKEEIQTLKEVRGFDHINSEFMPLFQELDEILQDIGSPLASRLSGVLTNWSRSEVKVALTMFARREVGNLEQRSIDRAITATKLI